MSDEPNTEAAKILDGAESAVGDLLASLRLPADNNTTVTVLDWLDTHGVLDAVDDAAHKIAADAEAAKAEAEAAKPSPVDGVSDAPAPPQVPAVAGEGDPIASGAVPATAPIEPTASAAQSILDTAEAKVEAAGTAEVEKLTTEAEKEAAAVAPEVKAGLTDALHNVLSWVEKL